MGEIHIYINGTICKSVELYQTAIVGRVHASCYQVSRFFSDSPAIIALEQAPKKVSGIHCLINRLSEKDFCIIDGWVGQPSTNGCYLNSFENRIRYSILKSGDCIYLGCEEVCIKYFSEVQQEDEKSTLV